MIASSHSSRSIVIPVEIQNREMTAKLYLAAVTAKQGFTAVVGDQKEIARGLHRLEPSIYLDKSIARTKRAHFSRLRRLGFVPVALCEEGLVYRNTERYVTERLDLTALGLVDKFFCWGNKHRQDVAAATSSPDKLTVVGNPRFDLLRPEFRSLWAAEAERLAAAHGPFILVNTNFGRANKLSGTADVADLLKKRGTLDPNDGPDYYRGLVAHLWAIHRVFLDLIPQITSAFPSHRIVVRPHPGEKADPYRELAERHTNVVIDNSGSVVPWILASEAVIHNSCTTGVEARILARPVLSFMPLEDDRYDSLLPNALSLKCRSPQEVVDTLAGVLDGRQVHYDDDGTALLDQYVTALSSDFSADRLVGALPERGIAASRFERLMEALVSIAKRLARQLPGLRVKGGLRILANQKFPGLTLGDAQETLAALSNCREELSGIQVAKAPGWRHVFIVSAKGE